jgi:hypothetical protein
MIFVEESTRGHHVHHPVLTPPPVMKLHVCFWARLLSSDTQVEESGADLCHMLPRGDHQRWPVARI